MRHSYISEVVDEQKALADARRHYEEGESEIIHYHPHSQPCLTPSGVQIAKHVVYSVEVGAIENVHMVQGLGGLYIKYIDQKESDGKGT